jgi:hypothetical protein
MANALLASGPLGFLPFSLGLIARLLQNICLRGFSHRFEGIICWTKQEYCNDAKLVAFNDNGLGAHIHPNKRRNALVVWDKCEFYCFDLFCSQS